MTDRSGPKARAPCSDRISYSQSYGIPRNPGRRPSWLPRPTGGRRSEGALPSPNSLSTASTPPARKGEKCYPCVRYEVSPMSRAAHVSIASQRTVAQKPRGTAWFRGGKEDFKKAWISIEWKQGMHGSIRDKHGGADPGREPGKKLATSCQFAPPFERSDGCLALSVTAMP